MISRGEIMKHIIEIDYDEGIITWNGEVWDRMSVEDTKEDFWDSLNDLIWEIRASIED